MRHDDTTSQPKETALTVGRLARLAGVSVRTLHHYDRIGLVRPSGQSPAGYRLYAADDCARLQQALLYRELGLGLTDIAAILDRPGFDRTAALRGHLRALRRRRERLEALIGTVETTIAAAEGERTMSTKQLFSGFDIDAVLAEQETHRAEVDARWDPALVAESRRRVAGLGKEGLGRVLAEQGEVTTALAERMKAGDAPGAPAVRELVARYRRIIHDNFYPVSDEIFAGLGRMYAEDPRFAATFEKVSPGLAAWLSQAVAASIGALD